MKKALSVLMILILLGLFAATYHSSARTETIYKAQLEQLNRSYAGFLSAELVEYRSGLLVSEVETNLTIQNETLPLQHQIRHFLWMVKVETRFADGSPITERLAELIGPDNLVLQTAVQLNGSSQTYFELPELALVEDQLNLLVRGVHVTADLDNRLSGKLVMSLDTLELAERGKIEITLSDILLDSEFFEQQDLPLGSGTVSIGNLTISPEDKEGFELNQLGYAVRTELQEDTLATAIELSFASLLLGNETFTAGAIDLRLDDIDVQVIREMQSTGRQMQEELLNKQVDPLILQLQLLGFYSQLFQKGLNISLNNLSLQADGGQLKGAGQVRLQGFDLMSGSLGGLRHLNGQFRLDIDKAIFNTGFRMLDNLQRRGPKTNRAVQNEQAEQVAGGLIQKGIFTQQESGLYRVDFSLHDGQGNLNGTPFRF